MNAHAHRPATPIDSLAEAHLERAVTLDPSLGIELGLPGPRDRFGDLSPAGTAAAAEAARDILARLAEATPVDAADAVTADALRERLGIELELHEAGLSDGVLNVIASPVQTLREIFDLAPREDAGDWEDNTSRLEDLPRAVDGYLESLRHATGNGRPPALRQVLACAEQCEDLAGPSSFFLTYAAGAGLASPAAQARLDAAAEGARAAYGTLGRALRDEFAPHAREHDAVGRDDYQLLSRAFLGSEVDLDETYAWGLAELASIVREQEATAEAIAPGAGVAGAVAALDADPGRVLHGTEALRDWMQETADEAIAGLGEHFDIPEPVRRIEAMIAPTQSGGIYYTPPSDDFSRPGRMWWAVPEGVTEFNTWRERTTVYHEGAPGHHLQVGIAMSRRDELNAWRRSGVWVSGSGEGWALYAERLMAQLGYLEDPADRLGMLDGQRMRAARVVVDIGVHLALPAPPEVGGGTWDAAKALEFMRRHVNMPDAFIRFEVDRYLGWPGQAPSYSIGQRLWEGMRDQSLARGVSLKDFHSRALGLGSLGLDTLARALG